MIKMPGGPREVISIQVGQAGCQMGNVSDLQSSSVPLLKYANAVKVLS